MGCGASIQSTKEKPATKSGWQLGRRAPTRPAAAPAPARAVPVPAAAAAAPASSSRRQTPPATVHRHAPPGYEGLRIETAPHSTPVSILRQDAGMAETPVGKLADEYKFFCPLCMMFYRRNISETRCCKQYICAFCLADFVHRKRQSPPAVATGGETSPASDIAPLSGELPKGMPCPHCASISTGEPLRSLDSKEEARSYMDSPTTRADLERASSNASDYSPLKIGDDFQTMARKMLPFATCTSESDPSAICAQTEPAAAPAVAASGAA